MTLLLDTNVLLDAFLRRQPHAMVARDLFIAAERGAFTGLICATSVTTVFYISARTIPPSQATLLIERLLQLFQTAPVTGAVLSDALKLQYADFEDALVCQAALTAGADGIVTRDPKGFRKSPIPVYDPENALMILSGKA